jgi:hypothetical protein
MDNVQKGSKYHELLDLIYTIIMLSIVNYQSFA